MSVNSKHLINGCSCHYPSSYITYFLWWYTRTVNFLKSGLLLSLNLTSLVVCLSPSGQPNIRHRTRTSRPCHDSGSLIAKHMMITKHAVDLIYCYKPLLHKRERTISAFGRAIIIWLRKQALWTKRINTDFALAMEMTSTFRSTEFNLKAYSLQFIGGYCIIHRLLCINGRKEWCEMLTSRSIGLFSSFFNCITVHPFLICLTHNAVGWAGEAVFTSRAPRMELRILGTRSSCWSRKPVSKPACALYLAHGFLKSRLSQFS